MNELDAHLKNIIKNNKLVCINKNIFLTNYEIDILKIFNIPYEQASNYQEILFYIEEELDQNNDAYELEQISSSISERNYYQFTHK